MADPSSDDADKPRRPLDRIGGLAIQEAAVTPDFSHVEIFTMEGLLTLLWHGDRHAEHVVLMCGGAMGGLLGPANGLYQDLGAKLAGEGIGTIRVGYRQPNDLAACTLDLGAAADLAFRAGARSFLTVGHSFGGAVALNAAIAMQNAVVGVVTLSTQSAGCEGAIRLGARPLLLLHGDRDEILPPQTSEIVHQLAGGHGELEILPGAGHLLTEVADQLRARLGAWIPAQFAAAQAHASAADPRQGS
jgi:dienelactone hydrolase